MFDPLRMRLAEAKKIIMDDNAALLTKLQEGQAKVAQEIQTVQGGASPHTSHANLAAHNNSVECRGFMGIREAACQSSGNRPRLRPSRPDACRARRAHDTARSGTQAAKSRFGQHSEASQYDISVHNSS